MDREKNKNDTFLEENARIRKVYQYYHNNKSLKTHGFLARSKGNEFILLKRKEVLIEILRNTEYFPIGDRKILDLGCGGGLILSEFVEFGAKSENLYGVDLIPERIEDAKSDYPLSKFSCEDAGRLHFPNSFFDLIIIFTVFSSILDTSMARSVAREALRVSKKGGLILIYDVRYSNPCNPYTRPISINEIRSYFDGSGIVQFYPVTLLPPLARLIAPISFRICNLLEKVPFLKSHYFITIKKVCD
ncbi:MAG: class I SAM-dependent methyltransferase [Candidatus Omnitrophica bacterium]|nr:class I SAM-dependent methyltransferase [Candidatus Omnitrophota bacterium]